MNKNVLIKYSEIKLKGKNKNDFVNQLVRNIKCSAKRSGVNLIDVSKKRDRILCKFNDKIEKIDECVKNVFGIKSYAFIEILEKKIEILKKRVFEIIRALHKKGIKILSFKTKRSSKQFQLNSVEINTKFGEMANNLGIKIDYKNSENVIYTDIFDKEIYLYTKKSEGFSGLPVSTSGRGLCLLSGGIDSPVAAFNVMKRGCTVDFIHFHSYASNEMAFKSKIKNTIEILNKFQFKCKLYLVPYFVFDLHTSGKILPRYETAFFKHYILKITEKIAKDKNYDAIVTGDNLAQVASQTIENLNFAQKNIDSLTFRPLLTYDKEEIIKLAKEIGTYDLSIEEYKDCCSIHSKDQTTKAKSEKLDLIYKKVNMEKLVEKSLESMEVFEIS